MFERKKLTHETLRESRVDIAGLDMCISNSLSINVYCNGENNMIYVKGKKKLLTPSELQELKHAEMVYFISTLEENNTVYKVSNTAGESFRYLRSLDMCEYSIFHLDRRGIFTPADFDYFEQLCKENAIILDTLIRVI